MHQSLVVAVNGRLITITTDTGARRGRHRLSIAHMPNTDRARLTVELATQRAIVPST
ncbi:MAG: hypothetical protein ABIX28_07760 [Vicinamibacterales bacterium]